MTGQSYSFTGVTNFRDFGGHATRGGKRVVRGRLFRSAHYGGVTDEDVATLDALGVKFLLDLRQKAEREAAPNRWSPAKVLYRDNSAPRPPTDDPPVREQTAEHGRNAMRAAYARYPHDERFLVLFREMFHELADHGGPIIIHCAAGKDRTGLACALILDALGVDRETIFADYLLTNASIDYAERAKLVRARLGADLSDEAVAPLIGVEEGYLQAGLGVIEEKHGALAGYVEQALGVSPKALARMREHLLD